MTNLERRLTLLEKRIGNVEARLKISDPDRPHFGSNHIGSKTKEVLIQEGFSLKNSYKPDIMTDKGKDSWNKAYRTWEQGISAFDEKKIQEIHDRIKEMLNPA